MLMMSYEFAKVTIMCRPHFQTLPWVPKLLLIAKIPLTSNRTFGIYQDINIKQSQVG